MDIRVNRIVEQTRAEGPGVRFCIYVQGCDLRCEGCANKEMWNISGGRVYDTKTIIEHMESLKGQIDGITFLGGEPTLQAAALCEIAKYAAGANLSVIMFTGRTIEELCSVGNEKLTELLSLVDLLIDGPFIKEKLDFSRPLVGSSNQRFIFLSDKITPESVFSLENKFELRITPGGEILVNGMGNHEKLKKALEEYF